MRYRIEPIAPADGRRSRPVSDHGPAATEASAVAFRPTTGSTDQPEVDGEWG